MLLSGSEEIPAIRFEGILSREDATLLAEALQALRAFDPRAIIARYAQTKPLLEKASEAYQTASLQVAMKLLLEAIRAYVFGFNEGAIFYSSLSVELALLRTAILKHGDTKMLEVKRQGKLTFSWLINNAEILSASNGDVAVAEKVKSMRDCYVHFENQLLFTEVGKLPYPTSSDIPVRDVEHILEVEASLRRGIDKIFPLRENLMNARCLSFVKARRRSALKKAKEALTGISSNQEHSRDIFWRLAEMANEQDVIDMLGWCMKLLENPAYRID